MNRLARPKWWSSYAAELAAVLEAEGFLPTDESQLASLAMPRAAGVVVAAIPNTPFRTALLLGGFFSRPRRQLEVDLVLSPAESQELRKSGISGRAALLNLSQLQTDLLQRDYRTLLQTSIDIDVSTWPNVLERVGSELRSLDESTWNDLRRIVLKALGS